MSYYKEIETYKSLSIQQLKESVSPFKLHKDQKIITFSKNFTISLSNYCQNQCGYCFYNYKVPKLDGEGNVVLIENDEINDLIQNALRYDCKEALLMSGERPESFKEVKQELERRNCHEYIEFIIDICTNLLELNLLPHTNLGLLTFEELEQLKKYNASMGLMLESTSEKLLQKGGVHEFSIGKVPEKRIKHISDAGKLKIPFTTGLLLGIGEDWDDRINDLILIRDLHRQYGHIQEVIIQNFVYKEGIPYKPAQQITIKDILKTAGIAKLIFEDEIAVQVAPNLISGYEADFIDMGVDDFGGISPLTQDYINPEKPWPQIEHLEKLCSQKGCKLKERLPIYEKYIHNPEFCPKNIKKRIDNIQL